MFDYHVSGGTLPQAYHKALTLLHYGKNNCPCPDWNTTQKEIRLTMFVEHPLSEPMISKLFIGGFRELEQYRQEILDGILDFEVERGNWSYTYHKRMEKQIPFVIEELRRNPYSRRAVISIRTDEDIGSSDPACFCSGTKIQTPNGKRNVETLQDGDEVYCYDFEKDIIKPCKIFGCFEKTDDCIKITTDFNSINVSCDQLLFTNAGWKKAKELTPKDKILFSDIPVNKEHSLWHLIGCLYGDGWLSTPTVGKRGIRRKDIGFSIHYKANEELVLNLFKEFTNNKIRIIEKTINSKVVSGNHISKKIEVSDCNLHDLLMNFVPCGKKVCGDVLIDINNITKQNMVDFLTGLFSSEGSICFRKNKIPSIELGMVWEECVNMVSQMLERLNIEHAIYHSGKTHSIRINNIDAISQFFNSDIDFRYDSRKQVKYLLAKAILNKTLRLGEKAVNGKLIWQGIDADIISNSMFVPIIKTEEIEKQMVYDFTVEDKDHSIVADNFVAHNCLQHIQYMIRENKLHSIVLFRSNDACKATFMNAFALIMLQKRIADELGVEVGTYTHRANSFHCYEKDFGLLEGYVKRIEWQTPDALTFSYEDEWKELMDEARLEIAKMVEELKTR